ncbi:Adenylate cyclase type 9 [Dissostichus eleginoides]|uniref:Adenylate cyclase type 9 n=1 Tax=Dissostichus eleginoides TaxID=100907 RepID=A0AAD9F7B8_DISEL|nr:Adenylate cyclase type 9 [Dissostichus eleginoides]
MSAVDTVRWGGQKTGEHAQGLENMTYTRCREGRFPEVKALLFLRGEVPEGPRGHGVTSPGDISSRGQSAQDAHQQLSVNQQLEIG